MFNSYNNTYIIFGSTMICLDDISIVSLDEKNDNITIYRKNCETPIILENTYYGNSDENLYSFIINSLNKE